MYSGVLHKLRATGQGLQQVWDRNVYSLEHGKANRFWGLLSAQLVGKIIAFAWDVLQVYCRPVLERKRCGRRASLR